MLYFSVNMKDGRTLRFDRKATYIKQLDKTQCLVFLTGEFGDVLGIIPVENILWIQTFEKGD